MRLEPLFIATVLLGGVATAEPAPEGVRPEDARAWEQAPTDSSVPVLGPVGRGLRAVGGFLVDVLTSPFRGAAYLEDHYHAFSRTRDFFYNADHSAGVVPTLRAESGFGFLIGARAFHDNVFGNHEHVSLRAGYGGAARYTAQGRVALPALLDGRLYFDGLGRYDVTDHLLFAGVGNPMDGGTLAPNGGTRYGEHRWLGTARAGVQHQTELVQLRAGARYIYNDRDFDEDVASSIADRYDTAMLPGFAGGIQLHEVSGELEVEIRDREAGNGVRLAGFGGRAFGDESTSFTHWGGELAAHVTPWREGRVLIARIAHEGVSDQEVPFTELPRLGGASLLRGYTRDQFRDRLSAIGTLEYRWRVHRVVDGSLFVETGKVGRTYDALTSTDDWHVGYGGGLVLHSADAPVLTFQVAHGDGLQLLMTTDVMHAFQDRGSQL